MEPFHGPDEVESYRRRLGILNSMVNMSEKIWISWTDDWQAQVIMDSMQHVTLKMTHVNLQQEAFVTIVYAKCTAIERLELWDSIFQATLNIQGPWIVGGYFNVILKADEKLGGLPIHLSETADLSHFVNNCGLMELKYSANPFSEFQAKMKKVKMALAKWNLHKAQAELTNNLHLEEACWKQKSGMRWFKDSDRNTKFFHYYVKGRRKKLSLQRIQNSQGDWISSNDDIGEEAVTFYQDQFRQLDTSTEYEMLKKIPALISTEQNESLIALPSNEVVKLAVYGLNGDSTSGPDGFSVHFFQVCWHIIGEDVTKMARAFFYGQDLPRFINHTNLVLIPKKEVVNTFTDLRPISLSTFANKSSPESCMRGL
ncbi:uncharacterized protein LOC132048806 [Lycium ferocissimum]|uniref:uncharacterized protein LOC132048806 n=1 Tax=Lycium ferocissimum TaxID=112874 RepID=UPI0028154A6D|nr:uncharacterized protein LOC132048806 [Lycium ferocissimum]